METNKQLIRRRFGRNFAQYHRTAQVQKVLCSRLAELIDQHITEPPARAMEIGTGTGFLTSLLLGRYPNSAWFLNDIADESQTFLAPYTTGCRTSFIPGDAELIALPDKLDLVASASTVQWFDDLAAFTRRVHESLLPGGILAFTTFGPDNFNEIKTLTGEGLDYLTLEEFRIMLSQQGYEIVESSQYTVRLAFDTPGDVLRHIKATGVNSLRPVRWGIERFTRFEQEYRDLFATTEGRVQLSYHPILIIARKPK